MAIYGIITFHTNHFALKTKMVLEENGKKSDLIPLPRELGSDCGLCCMVSWEEKDEAEKILKENSVEIVSILRWERDEDKGRKKKSGSGEKG
jgi:hypothetical protein